MRTKHTMRMMAVFFGLVLGQDASAFYNPHTGRWLSRDPVGLRGGIAAYGFVRNATVNSFDAKGLAPAPSFSPCKYDGWVHQPPPNTRFFAFMDLIEDPSPGLKGGPIPCQVCNVQGVKYEAREAKCRIKIYIHPTIDDSTPTRTTDVLQHEWTHGGYAAEYFRKTDELYRSMAPRCIPTVCDHYRTEYLRDMESAYLHQRYMKDAQWHVTDNPPEEEAKWKRIAANEDASMNYWLNQAMLDLTNLALCVANKLGGLGISGF